MNFERLLTEYDFAEIKRQAENFGLFEFERFDKANKIELRISARHCDNGIWRDNYLVCVDGSKKYGDYHGFGSPYQRAEFLTKTYDDVLKMFACYGYSTNKVKQMDMFSIFQLAKTEQRSVYKV